MGLRSGVTKARLTRLGLDYIGPKENNHREAVVPLRNRGEIHQERRASQVNAFRALAPGATRAHLLPPPPFAVLESSVAVALEDNRVIECFASPYTCHG